MKFVKAENQIRLASESEAETEDVIRRMEINANGPWGRIDKNESFLLVDLFLWGKTPEGCIFWDCYDDVNASMRK